MPLQLMRPVGVCLDLTSEFSLVAIELASTFEKFFFLLLLFDENSSLTFIYTLTSWGDGIIDATIWDVAINPVYQGYGLGKQLMEYLMKSLKREGISRVTLFADSDVITFYKRQGWTLEPKGNKCAFWYSN